MSHVKKMHENKRSAKLYDEYKKKEELNVLRDKNSPEYSNWRGNVTEGMNTSNVFFTTLPSTGEIDLESIQTDTISSFASAGGDAAFENSAVTSSGSGAGDDGGFDIGNHLTFNGDGAPRWAILKPIDSSKFDTFVINAIRGNDNNGGEDPDAEGEELRLYYLPPGGSTFRSITRNTSNELVLSADSDIIIPLGSSLDGLKDYSITLPSYARGEGFSYMLYQQTNSGTGFDNYGIKSVKYKRRAPLSVFLPLDSPEAVSFINDGSGGLTPEEKKKRLDDMLAASDEYVETAFPENKIVTDRVKDQIQQTIASTDRQKFDDVQRAMTYDETLPDRTQIEAASNTYRQELENEGLKPGEFGAIEFYDWFRQQPEFIAPGDGNVNLKDFDPKSYQSSQKSAEVQFWSDPAKLAANEDIQTIFDPVDQLDRDTRSKNFPPTPEGDLAYSIQNIRYKGRIDNYGLNKLDDSYIDVPPVQKQLVYSYAKSAQKKQLSGKVRVGYYSMITADQYYRMLTEGNSAYWASDMMKEKHPDLNQNDPWPKNYVWYSNWTYYVQIHEGTWRTNKMFGKNGPGGKYSDYALTSRFNDSIEGYHAYVGRLHDLEKQIKNYGTDGYLGAEYNAILHSISDFVDLINPGTITGKGALFGDTWADLYWGKEIPESKDRTLPGFVYKVLDTEEIAFNFSNSEQTELRRLASQFEKAEDFVGYDPNADVDAYTTAGGAALNYSIPIAKSILINRPIVIDPATIPPQYITTMAVALDPRLFNQNKIGGYSYNIPIVTSPVPYADDNIFVGSNGKVQSNIGPNGQLAYYKKDTTLQPYSSTAGYDSSGNRYPVPLFGGGNAIAMQGQAQYQMVVPKDGSEPYLYYMDHAYENLKSTDPNEVPGSVGGFNPKKFISNAVHALRDIMQITSGDMKKTSPDQSYSDAPNTGAMAGYPPNIRGDVITHIKIPMSMFPLATQRKIKSEILKLGFGADAVSQNVKKSERIKSASDAYIDPVSGRLGSYGLDVTTAGTVRPISTKDDEEEDPKSLMQQDLEDIFNDPKNTPVDMPMPRQPGGGNMPTPPAEDLLNPDKAEDYIAANPKMPDYVKDSIRRQYKGGPDYSIEDKKNIINWQKKMKASNTNTDVAHYEPKGNSLMENYEPKAKHNEKVSKVTGRLKSPKEFFSKDVKPVFPDEPPPEMINGRHPDLVDGEKISQRFNRLDPVSAKAMPKTGNPKIDAKVAKALKKPK